MPITFAVLLWPRAGQIDEFLAYEADALELLQNHGGRVLRRVRRVDGNDTDPFEIHILELPDEEALARWQSDPRREAMAARRDACVARTVRWNVEDIT